ncbi:MAG: hypothetical protein IIU86_05790 [Oscillospiraceae bacterium]|nr:hypothetical protein [Oscillospiraceae bacterium]
MLKNLIILPDGTELFSGVGTVNALQNVTVTQRVNAGTELTLGSACANMLEATLITPAGGLQIPAGMEVTLYKVDAGGNRIKVGLFTAESPTRPSTNLYKITAYDRVSRLDRDLTQWLSGLDGWPYTLDTFARMVCTACNLTLANATLPNGSWPVPRFSASGITGRQLMQWVGQTCGRFCRATPDGELEFAWYTPKNISISPNGERPIQALRFEDYQVTPVDKVQIRQTETDVGAVWGNGSNVYVITGNPLLASDTLAPLQAVAQTLCNTLQSVSYTPCRVSIPATVEIQAGDILPITDKNGKNFTMYVMTKVQSGPQETLECTGSATRDSATAVSNSQLTKLAGKVLEVQMSMEGIKVANRSTDGKVAELEVAVNGLQTRVSDQQSAVGGVTDRVSTMEQTAAGLSLQLQNMQENGASKVSTTTGYTFDENGITVEKSGREIKTQITENGMTVYKNGSAVLIANSGGVDAVDLNASTYLIVGGRSRFENYGSNRTGCFWIGG